MRANRATAVAIAAISLVLALGTLLGCVGRDLGEDKEAVYRQLMEAAASVSNDEEFAAVLADLGFEADIEHARAVELAESSKGQIATKCWCDLDYPWVGPGGWVEIWSGPAQYDGIAYGGLLWGDPNYDLDLVIIVYPPNSQPQMYISAFKSSNVEYIGENCSLTGCSILPPIFQGCNIQLTQGVQASAYAAMWNMYGVSGPMVFSCCAYIEPL